MGFFDDLFSVGNPQQEAIEKAYSAGVDASESEGWFLHGIRDCVSTVVPSIGDEQKAFQAGYDDASRGKA